METVPSDVASVCTNHKRLVAETVLYRSCKSHLVWVVRTLVEGAIEVEIANCLREVEGCATCAGILASGFEDVTHDLQEYTYRRKLDHGVVESLVVEARRDEAASDRSGKCHLAESEVGETVDGKYLNISRL